MRRQPTTCPCSNACLRPFPRQEKAFLLPPALTGRPPRPKIANLTKAEKHLQKAREIATKALSDGVIVEHETVIEIRSHEVATKLNDLRRSAIELLNGELFKHQLDVIDHEL